MTDDTQSAAQTKEEFLEQLEDAEDGDVILFDEAEDNVENLSNGGDDDC